MEAWMTEELNHGLVASCVRWLVELVRPVPKKQRRSVTCVSMTAQTQPLGVALMERTWRGRWLTSVVVVPIGIDPAEHREAATFAAAQLAFRDEVQVAVLAQLEEDKQQAQALMQSALGGPLRPLDPSTCPGCIAAAAQRSRSMN